MRRTALQEVRRECLRVHQLVEGHVGIGAGSDQPCRVLVAAADHHARHPAIPNLDAIDRRPGMNRDAHRTARTRDALGQRAHPAAHVAPDAAYAVAFSHHVVEQDVGRSRQGRRRVRADHGVGGQGDFELLAFEPFVQKVGAPSRSSIRTTSGHFLLRGWLGA